MLLRTISLAWSLNVDFLVYDIDNFYWLVIINIDERWIRAGHDEVDDVLAEQQATKIKLLSLSEASWTQFISSLSILSCCPHPVVSGCVRLYPVVPCYAGFFLAFCPFRQTHGMKAILQENRSFHRNRRKGGAVCPQWCSREVERISWRQLGSPLDPVLIYMDYYRPPSLHCASDIRLVLGPVLLFTLLFLFICLLLLLFLPYIIIIIRLYWNRQTTFSILLCKNIMKEMSVS